MKKSIGLKVETLAKVLFWVIGCFGGALLFSAFPDIHVLSFFISFIGAMIIVFPMYAIGHILYQLDIIAENTKNIEQNTVDVYLSDDGAIKDIRLNIKNIADTLKDKTE